MEETKNTKRGGIRIGSGRKPWSQFKEPTKPIRIPESQELVVKDFLEALKRKQRSEQLDNVISIDEPLVTHLELPLYSTKVAAGLPSPADDHVEKRLDLNDYLITQADATFFVRVSGDSMIEAGIFDNDIAIVDKSRLAKVGDIVLAEVDGDFTIKSLAKSKQGLPRLLPANPKFSPIEISEGMQFSIIGVVTGTARKFK